MTVGSATAARAACFGNGKDDHAAALLAKFVEGFRGEALAGGAPLEIFEGDALALLPAGIEDGGFETGAAGDVGIALGGDVQSAALRAFDHGDQLRSVFQTHAGDVHDVKRRAGGSSGGDDFFNADQAGGRFL